MFNLTKNMEKKFLDKQFLQCKRKYLWNSGIAEKRGFRYTNFRLSARHYLQMKYNNYGEFTPSDRKEPLKWQVYL